MRVDGFYDGRDNFDYEKVTEIIYEVGGSGGGSCSGSGGGR